MGIVVDQLATGGGTAHLEEELACDSVSSLTNSKLFRHGTYTGYIPQVNSHRTIADFRTRRKPLQLLLWFTVVVGLAYPQAFIQGFAVMYGEVTS